MTQEKTAELFRMVTPEHTCPFGVLALELLERQGFRVNEHLLTTRADVDAFKREHGVATTPQTFIDGRRIGGHDDLVAFFAAGDI